MALSFREIADLHVPSVDVMGAVLDDGLYPPLGPGAVVGRLETVDGAVLTYHREMTLAGGKPNAVGGWRRQRGYGLLAPSAKLVAGCDPGAGRIDVAAEFSRRPAKCRSPSCRPRC